MKEHANIQQLIAKATTALATLATTEATRGRSQTETDVILEAVKPMILQARAKRHGFKRITELLRSNGVTISAETLRRRFPTTRIAGVNSTSRAQNKSRAATHEKPLMLITSRSVEAAEESNTKPQVAPQVATDSPPMLPVHAGARRAKV